MVYAECKYLKFRYYDIIKGRADSPAEVAPEPVAEPTSVAADAPAVEEIPVEPVAEVASEVSAEEVKE